MVKIETKAHNKKIEKTKRIKLLILELKNIESNACKRIKLTIIEKILGIIKTNLEQLIFPN